MSKHPRTRSLACWLLTLALAPAPMIAQPAPVMRLNQLAIRLTDGPAPLQADLARIALAELAAVYADEAQRAQRDTRHQSGDHNLRGWAAAVQRLASDYATLAETVHPDTPIELSIGPDNSLNLVVAGQLVVVSSPRMNEQAAFEQRVIQQFCELNRCEGLLDTSAVDAPIDGEIAPAQWIFSDQTGPACSSEDGLEFQFNNLENLDRKRAACASVIAELHRLAAAIAREIASGVRVEWDALEIYNRPVQDQQKVMLNTSGASVQLSLPFLAARQALFSQLRPWLAANVRGERYNLVVINAGDRLASPGQALE